MDPVSSSCCVSEICTFFFSLFVDIMFLASNMADTEHYLLSADLFLQDFYDNCALSCFIFPPLFFKIYVCILLLPFLGIVLFRACLVAVPQDQTSFLMKWKLYFFPST